MTDIFIEPTQIEVRLTLALGQTLLAPYYRNFAKTLALNGSENVMDFGSGSGVCSKHIAAKLDKRKGLLTCVDISNVWQRVIKNTLRRFVNIRYRQGKINDLDIRENSFDMIVIHFVLHDIPAGERMQVILSLVKKLKSGGRLVIREPLAAGITEMNLLQCTRDAGIKDKRFKKSKIFIGYVLDGVFTKN